MNWNFDMTTAPKGHYRSVTKVARGKEYTTEEHVPVTVFAAGGDGVTVTPTRWLPKEGRWNMFTKDAPPIAWMPWPTHPGTDNA